MDLAKGIGIIAVILAHILSYGKLRLLFYTFHLPLFFIISGYFFHYDGSFYTFIKRKLRNYLIPYISCALIISIFEFFNSGLDSNVLLNHISLFIIQRRFTTLWFLATLFCSTIIFTFVYKLCKGNTKIISLSTITLSTLFIAYDEYIGKALIWNLDTSFIATIFILIGHLMNKHKILHSVLNHSILRRIICINFLIITGLVCTASNYFICRKPLEMFACQYGIFPLTILAACSFSIAIIIFCGFLEKMIILQWLGRNTMAFFAFHQVIGIPVTWSLLNNFSIFITPGSIAVKTIRTILLFTGIMIICYIIHFILIKFHLGLALGKFKAKA